MRVHGTIPWTSKGDPQDFYICPRDVRMSCFGHLVDICRMLVIQGDGERLHPQSYVTGQEAQARAMLLNTELKRLGTSQTAKFLDLSGAVQGEGRLAHTVSTISPRPAER